MNEPLKFGEKLRFLRLSQKLTLSDLASTFGYSTHSYLSEVESGKKPPTISIVLMTSRYFEISTDYLLKDEMEIILDKEKF